MTSRRVTLPNCVATGRPSLGMVRDAQVITQSLTFWCNGTVQLASFLDQGVFDPLNAATYEDAILLDADGNQLVEVYEFDVVPDIEHADIRMGGSGRKLKKRVGYGWEVTLTKFIVSDAGLLQPILESIANGTAEPQFTFTYVLSGIGA